MRSVPDELKAERDVLIAEIRAAFDGVSREGGISWSESKAHDDTGSSEACAKARAKDTDQDWIELVADDKWRVNAGIGGFSFLDPISFRHYLPAAMIRNIRVGEEETLSIVLALNKATRPTGKLLRDSTLEQGSLFDARQCRCVARFIRFKIGCETDASGEGHPGLDRQNNDYGREQRSRLSPRRYTVGPIRGHGVAASI